MIIDDNFIENKKIKQLQEIMYSDEMSKFPWFYDIKNNNDGHNQFVHLAMENAIPISPFVKEAKDLLENFCSKNNITINKIENIKTLFILKNNNLDSKPEDLIHTDIQGKHLVFLYYVNDADSSTVFFNERYNHNLSDILHTSGVIQQQSGRGLVFDGLKYRSFTAPKNDDFSCVISISFYGSGPV